MLLQFMYSYVCAIVNILYNFNYKLFIESAIKATFMLKIDSNFYSHCKNVSQKSSFFLLFSSRNRKQSFSISVFKFDFIERCIHRQLGFARINTKTGYLVKLKKKKKTIKYAGDNSEIGFSGQSTFEFWLNLTDNMTCVGFEDASSLLLNRILQTHK